MSDEFIAHGTYCVSNSIGYEIQLSDCGDAARARYRNYDDTFQITDWCEIEYQPDPDDANAEYQPFIMNCFGSDIPLDQVMRI